MDISVISDAELLAEIKAFCADKSIKHTTFGREVLGDGSLIANLEAGRSLTLRNAAKIADFISTYQPAQAAA